MKLILITLAALTLVGCDAPAGSGFDTPKAKADPCMLQEENIRADMGKAQLTAQLELSKNFTAIQLAVAKSCSEHGRIPVFMNGNVDCKPGAK